jgi:hypothetical protein
MGDSTQSGVKVFDEAEVKHLSSDDRRKLEEHVLKQIADSQDIRSLVKAKVKPFLDGLT